MVSSQIYAISTNAPFFSDDKPSFKDEQLLDVLFPMMIVFWHKSKEKMRGKAKIS